MRVALWRRTRRVVRRLISWQALAVVLGVLIGIRVDALMTDGPLTPLNILRGRTDENGYLRVLAAMPASPTDGDLTPLGILRGRTDENGYLRVSIAAGSNVAPADATYITQTANSQLTAEQALASLATGLMFNTTTTGVVSTVVCGTAGTVLQGGAPPTCTANPTLSTIVGSGGQTLDLSAANVTTLGGALRVGAGSVSAPSLSFTTSTTTGFYDIQSNGIRWGVAGVAIGDIYDTGIRPVTAKNNLIDLGGVGNAWRAGYFGTSINLNTSLTFSATAPTFTSGFGGATGRTITGSAAVFSIVVGSSSTDNNGVLGLPTATNGWVCRAENQTSPGATDIKQSSSTTSSVTLTQYNTTLGTAANFAASDVIKGTCIAY